MVPVKNYFESLQYNYFELLSHVHVPIPTYVYGQTVTYPKQKNRQPFWIIISDSYDNGSSSRELDLSSKEVLFWEKRLLCVLWDKCILYGYSNPSNLQYWHKK